MLRGFRWQLLAFVVSAILFALVLYIRSENEPQPPVPTRTPIEVAVTPTPAPTSEPTAIPVITQATVDPILLIQPEDRRRTSCA
jgi:hypothetical protein